jgi:hypothetical protein
MHRSFLVAAGVAATVLGPAVAVAAAPGAHLSPNKVSAASRLHVEVDASAADFGGRFPNTVVATVQRGFKLDQKAVAITCSDEQAAAVSCPAGARVSTGQAVVSAGAFGTYTAKVESFLATTKQAGDLAGVVIQVTEPSTGTRKSVRGSVRAGTGDVGYELRFENLQQALPTLPPGVTLSLVSLNFEVGANRTVKKIVKKKNKKTKKVKKKTVVTKYSLITNPATCAASGWTATVTAVFADGSQVAREYAAPCQA